MRRREKVWCPMLLIVENDPGFSAKLKQNVKLEGLKTLVVDSVSDGLYLVGSAKVEIILANLNVFASPEELDELMAAATGKGASLLLIEGFANTDALGARARNAGHSLFITLPFNSRDLMARLQRLRANDDALIGARIGPAGHEIEILRKVGAGAMGAVYEGYETSLDRRVAVKFLRMEQGGDREDLNRRFLHEARAVAQMRSPHVVQIFFVGSHEGMPYLVMEFIDGPTLASVLGATKIMAPPEALRIARQVLSGLSHAHQRAKVHRDLKPANIMINQQGQAMILDYGLVRDAGGQNLTKAGMILGTPRYIAPEQVKGREVDHRCDLYALGIILFEMLLGEAPFVDKDPMAVLMKQASHPLPRPEEIGVELDPRLFAIVERLTRKRPIERFQSADEVAEAIDAYRLSVGYTSGFGSSAELNVGASSNEARRLEAQSTSAVTASHMSRTPTSVRSIHSLVSGSTPVPKEVVDELFDQFTEVLGPLARRLGERDATRLGLDMDQLTSASWSDLINILAGRIEDEGKQEAFVDRAVLLRNKFL